MGNGPKSLLDQVDGLRQAVPLQQRSHRTPKSGRAQNGIGLPPIWRFLVRDAYRFLIVHRFPLDDFVESSDVHLDLS